MQRGGQADSQARGKVSCFRQRNRSRGGMAAPKLGCWCKGERGRVCVMESVAGEDVEEELYYRLTVTQ